MAIQEMTCERLMDYRRVIVIIPAYNEERFIGSVVLKARQHADAVIVVDDGSTDDTAAVAEAAGAVVVRHQQNRGKGAALNTAFREARAMGAGVVVTVDGDGQHRCDEIGTLIEPVLNGEADMAVGSRFLDVRSEIPAWRVFGQHSLTVATNLGSGFSLTDSQSGFRAFSPRAVRTLAFNSAGFSVESEMQFLAREHGLRVVEIPITCSYEDPPKRNPVAHGLQVLNGMIRLVGQHRPLLFFGVPGLAGLLFGLLWGLLVVDIYSRTQVLAFGYSLIAVLFTLAGVLTMLTGIILHSIRGLLVELKESFGR